MAAIPQYNESVLPQGQINSQATPNDFGAQAGTAMRGFGDAVEGVENYAIKVNQDNTRIKAYKDTGDAYLNLKKQFDTNLNSLDPNDPAFTDKIGNLASDFHEQIDQTTSDLQSNAGSRLAARLIASHMAENGRSLLNYAAAEQSKVMGDYTSKQIQDGLKTDQDSVSADPSNDNYDRILTNRKEMIGGLNNIDPTKKIDWLDKIEHGLALTQVQVLASTNPNGFLQSVNAQGGKVSPNGTAKGGVPGGTVSGSGFDNTMQFIFAKEGGYKATDGNTDNPVNFGINQKANPDINVKDLTKDQASEIYKSRYWTAIGGDSLPANMQTVAMNAAVNMGVAPAKELLAQAGNDPAKFTELAKQRYQSIAASDPAQAKYLGEWQSRADDALATSAQAGAGNANPNFPQVQPLTDQDIAAAKAPIQGWDKLSWAEKVTSVRQAEGAAGAGLAQQRGELTRAMSDINSTLMSGISYPGIDDPKFSKDNLTKVFGPDEGQRAFDRVQYSKQVGSFITQMSTTPLAQAQETLKGLAPEGGYEFAAKAPVYQQAVQALSRLQDLRNKDYMSWAQNTPNTNVKPLDFSSPDNFRSTLTARIAPAITGMQDYGADAHLMSKDESERLGDAITNLPPQTQIAYLKSVRQATIGHDDWFGDTLGQLSAKNTMLGFAAAVANRNGAVDTAAGQQSGSTVGQYVLEGAHILQGKDLDDPAKSGRPLKLDDNVIRNLFWNEVGSKAFEGPDAQQSSQTANDTYQAVKNYLVADMYHRGNLGSAPRSSDVSNAVKAVTGGSANVGGYFSGSKLFVPWGMTEERFQQKFPSAVDKAIIYAGLKDTKLDAPDGFHYMNAGDGKYLVTNGAGRPLVSPTTGKSVIVDLSENNQGAR